MSRNQTFNSYYLEMWATEWFLKWEIKTLVDKLRDKEEEIKKLKSDLSLVIKERDDNIEQNKKLKSELEELKKIRTFNSDERELTVLTSSTPQYKFSEKYTLYKKVNLPTWTITVNNSDLFI